MRDFNFFEPYLTKKGQLTTRQLIVYISISVIGIILVILPIVNQIIIKRMENQMIAVSAVVESEEFREARDKVNNREKQIQEIQKYYKALESIDEDIKHIDLINDLFIQTITDRVPEGVFFQSINITQDIIQITGIAKNNGAIAEFEHNLRDVPYFENVFIPSISANTGSYTFTISFKIKGGIDDEAN